MTQSDLASATGISVAYTNQIITGRKPAPQSWLEIVAEHLKLPEHKKADLLTKAKHREFTLPSYNDGEKQ